MRHRLDKVIELEFNAEVGHKAISIRDVMRSRMIVGLAMECEFFSSLADIGAGMATCQINCALVYFLSP